jgi:O-succinylbenzoic acid--CoA ligase
MQFMRSFTTGGRMVILPFKDMIAGARKDIDPSSFFISLVPTQLARLLTHDWVEYLSKFQAVLLGGSPAWEELLKQARLYNIPLAPTYGMTETASQVVTLKPDAFLAGNNSCGQILPHAQVTIRSFSGEILGANQTGIVTIQADSLALGYYLPGESLSLQPLSQNLKSDDLGFFDDQGYLNVVGRSSNKIITGGENVFPAEVEAAIQATQLVTDVCVTGLPDSHWGQIVTAVYVARSQAVSPTILQKAIEDKLTKYKRPKHWVPLESLPRNLQGKVNYEEIIKAALASRNAV